MKEEILKLITEEVLDQQLKARNKIRQYGMPDKEFGFELKIKHFLKLMFVHFTSQSYGARIENRLSKEYNLTKVPSSKDEGDATTSNGKSVEIKISFKNSSNDFSFVQIRPHQKCDLYLLHDFRANEKNIAFNSDIRQCASQFFSLATNVKKDITKKIVILYNGSNK